jgi:transcriptional regulator with XRE-family HTH domain
MTGAELKAARERLGLTQSQLASLMGASARTVGGWEQGERNGKPNTIPEPVALLMAMALRHPALAQQLKKKAPKGL